MHYSVVLKKLRNNEPVWCTKTNLIDPNVVEIYGHLGIHCVWLCMEHMAVDFQTVHNQVRAAKAFGMDSMVRVAKGCYSDWVRPLEMDATGLMVPHVMSRKEAEDIVRMTRFQPWGRRPWEGGNSDGAFALLSPEEYVRFQNEERFIVIQIEDKEAVDCLEEIVQVDHIDVFFLGPCDLAHSYGFAGQIDHPLVHKAVDKLAETCAKHKKNWGMPCSPETAGDLIERGARFLTCGADILAITDYYRNLRRSFEALGLTFSSQFH